MRILKKAVFIISCLCWPLGQLSAATEIIAADYLETSPHRELIELALRLTEAEYGSAVLTFSSEMVQGRAEQELKEGKRLHLVVFAPSPERERDLLPVYFPLSQGLLGYRACIIADGQQAKFDHIVTLQDWQKAELSVGQAAHWPDVTILRHNNITVVTNPIYQLLFDMVRQHRFDCFARSFDELNRDLQRPPARGLVAEQQLLLYYPQLSMIFISRSYPQLAERLEKGLTLAWQQGLVQQHFQRHYGEMIDEARCMQRRIIKLENPLLSEESRVALQKYALSPEQLLVKPIGTCSQKKSR